MKNIFYDNEDIQPIILLAFSLTIANISGFLFGGYITSLLFPFALMHILAIFKLKYSKPVPITKIIKYAIYVILFNSVSLFLISSLNATGIKPIIGLIAYNFLHVGFIYVFMCFIVLWFIDFLAQKNKQKRKKVTFKLNKFIPALFSCFNLVMILVFFIVFKTNISGTLIEIFTVVPYSWYVINLVVQMENMEEFS